MRTLIVIQFALLLSLLRDVESCQENLSGSSWSLEVETEAEPVLVARWDSDSLSCSPSLMLSVLSPQEERMSVPVSVAAGSVRFPVQVTCDVLQVRLATVVPGDSEVSYISEERSVWLPAQLSDVFLLPTTLLLSLPPSCPPPPDTAITTCSSSSCSSSPVSGPTTYIREVTACSSYRLMIEVGGQTVWQGNITTPASPQVELSASADLRLVWPLSCSVSRHLQRVQVSLCQDRNQTKTFDEDCLTLSVGRNDIIKDTFLSDILPCTLYSLAIRVLYLIEEADLQIKEELFFSESSPCPEQEKGITSKVYVLFICFGVLLIGGFIYFLWSLNTNKYYVLSQEVKRKEELL